MENLDKITEVATWLSDNWGYLVATVLTVIASADKVAMVALKTAKNIRDEWYSTFGDRRE